ASLSKPVVLDMSVGNNASVSVTGGLTVNNGTIPMGNSSGGYAALAFNGAASTFGGTNAHVSFSNLSNSPYNVVQQTTAGGTLTIGPGVTIHGGTGAVGYNSNYGGSSNVTVVNQGTIIADSAGTVTVNGVNWSNAGAIAGSGGGNVLLAGTSGLNSGALSIIGGGSLTIGGAWTSPGTISETSSTINLGGTFNLAQLANFTRSGGNVNLTGTLNNVGTTLALNATSGSWNIVGGTINGGRVTAADGARLYATGSGGSLTGGVVLEGDATLTQPTVLDMTAVQNANVTVAGGLTMNNATAALGNSTGSYGALRFSDTNSLLGGTNSQVVFSSGSNSGYNTLASSVGGGTLTIGSGLTIHGGAGAVGYNNIYGGPSNVSLVNQGTILADAAGGLFVQGASVNNQGVIGATGAGVLSVQPTTLTNYSSGTLTGGTWQATSGGTLRLISATGITTDAATIVVDGASSNIYRDTGTTSALSGLATIAAAGSLTLANNRALTTAGSLTNAGTLNIQSGAVLTPGGAFTQTGGATNLQGGTLGAVRPVGSTALSFTRNTDHVSLPSAVLNGRGNVTTEFWFQTTRTGEQSIVSGANASNANAYLIDLVTPTQLQFYSSTSGSTFVSWTIPSVADGRWHHMAVVRDDSADQATLYLDGVSYGARSMTMSTLSIASGGLLLSQEQDSVGGSFDVNQVFQGQLDDLRVWNGVRTASEIQSNMLTRLTGAESGLIGLWDFEDGAGSTVTDRTANHYNGSFSSPAPTWTTLPSNAVNL
ncbi:MAG TPA: LamG domain-containing protein, partial [Pirellulaceae bacterium]|nr:LamG domain-containing protein [Pirellulaceae bacterium]